MVKNPPANVGDAGSIPASGRSPREGNGNPLQYSCLGNPTGGEVWWVTVRGVTKESDTTERLNNKKQASHCARGPSRNLFAEGGTGLGQLVCGHFCHITYFSCLPLLEGEVYVGHHPCFRSPDDRSLSRPW